MPGARTTKEREARDASINLRASQRQRALIDWAAEVLGKNRSDFILEADGREANTVLLDRRVLLLDEKAYKRFTEVLDKPPADNPRLRRLMRTPAPGRDDRRGRDTRAGTSPRMTSPRSIQDPLPSTTG